MAKQECVKKGIAQPIRAAQGKIEAEVDDPNRTVWYYAGNEFAVPTDQWNEIFARYKADTDQEHREVIEAGEHTIFRSRRPAREPTDNTHPTPAAPPARAGASPARSFLEPH